ncbi:hypothetical protein LK09_00895 [Microbacterium mangrovi]|uniref:Uncharacterized protein n=1 Tax=Microbacterium mangrovi TaxID=1348253 RepID=A0A0B2A9S5_9MICO|nr:hypothetical protein [Microbacterium mangrovi]KHK99919.1 hypothetical protein LK09_00895 [Microbacterium mangrovi]
MPPTRSDLRADPLSRHRRRERLAWAIAGASLAVTLLISCFTVGLLQDQRPATAGGTRVASTITATTPATRATDVHRAWMTLAQSFARGYAANDRYATGICGHGDWFGWEAGVKKPSYLPFTAVRTVGAKPASGTDDGYWVYEVQGKDRAGTIEHLAVVVDITGTAPCVASLSTN